MGILSMVYERIYLKEKIAQDFVINILLKYGQVKRHLIYLLRSLTLARNEEVIINTDALDPDPVLRCIPTKRTKMLSGKDKALLVKLFYLNEESATVALRKFRLQKNVRTGKGPLIVADLTKLVQPI
ncbi:hypothetical protein NPIL_563101 [Nephila pilipes]|uniref:Uncharacterized protein n=1 Tax=Nephila pilipes TaxID=299642 RepID=A0A8X6NBX4_NEPPI|nr:hypothetical protein NPIL_563101 [Nephila pilipes]